MTLTLQIFLIIFTVLFFIILVKNVKKGKLRTDYALVSLLFDSFNYFKYFSTNSFFCS